ncbi:MAG: hypothetical protein EGR84_02005, partial [Coprococcus catus]|nr:hypothetical protein [Coprococcus catus]
NACIFKTVFEILFGGYATPTKCVAFWRLALNSYDKIMIKTELSRQKTESVSLLLAEACFND